MELFKNILAVIDTNADSGAELARAQQLCRQWEAKLYLIDVVKSPGAMLRFLSRDYSHIQELLVGEKVMGLAKLVLASEKQGISATSEVVEGPTSQATIDIAKRMKADLIVRAAKGARSLSQGPLGASAQQLLRRPPCPVWLVKGEQTTPLKLIVAAVDASPDDQPHAQLNRRIIQTAMELAKKEDSRLLIVYAWNLFSAEMLSHRLPPREYQVLMDANRKQHSESFQALLGEFDLDLNSPQVRLLEGEPSTCIPDVCTEEQADLLVCGTVARQGIADLLLGNTAERILNRVDCSSLAITPPS